MIAEYERGDILYCNRLNKIYLCAGHTIIPNDEYILEYYNEIGKYYAITFMKIKYADKLLIKIGEL